MRQAAALLAVFALLLGACGKYGSPVRSRPAPPAQPAAGAEAEAQGREEADRESLP
jgi:hypothetical protein